MGGSANLTVPQAKSTTITMRLPDSVRAWQYDNVRFVKQGTGDNMDNCDEKCAETDNLAKQVINLDRSDEQNLLLEFNVVNEDGTLTYDGKELLLNLLFKDKKKAIVEKLTQLKESRNKVS